MRNRLLFGLSTIALSTLIATSASATMITGSVDTQGTAGVTGVSIDFYNGIPSCSTGPNLGIPGCFQAGSGTGSFLTDTNTNGSVMDLTGGPVTGPNFVANFMTFANGVTFDLTAIPFAGLPGCSTVDPTQGGVTCVPNGAGNSPFRLTNGPGPNPDGSGTASSVAIQFTVSLDGYTGTSASGFTTYQGIFTTQVANENIANVLADLGGGGAFVHAYSATFNPITITPEPGSMALMGLGLIGLPMVARRLRRR